MRANAVTSHTAASATVFYWTELWGHVNDCCLAVGKGIRPVMPKWAVHVVSLCYSQTLYEEFNE